jgi:chromosome partitioning protein
MSPSGTAADQQVEQAWAEEDGARPAPDWGAGEVRSPDAPPDQSEVSAPIRGRPEDIGASERQASQGERTSEGLELPDPPAEPEGAPLTADDGTTVGPPSGGPVGAAATSGARGAVPGPGEATTADASAAEAPRGAGPEVGWFSAEGSASQYTGALSEQLSAERPSDELDRSSEHEAPTADGAGLTPAPEESRSPELIESGMVHVDPDPEIGSPPQAAGWTEHPPGHVVSQAPDRSHAGERPMAVAEQARQVGEGAGSLGPDAARPGSPGATDQEDSGLAAAESGSASDRARSDLDAVDRPERSVNDSDPATAAMAGGKIDGTVAPAEARSGLEVPTGTETPGPTGATEPPAGDLPPARPAASARSAGPTGPEWSAETGGSAGGGSSTATGGPAASERPKGAGGLAGTERTEGTGGLGEAEGPGEIEGSAGTDRSEPTGDLAATEEPSGTEGSAGTEGPPGAEAAAPTETPAGLWKDAGNHDRGGASLAGGDASAAGPMEPPSSAAGSDDEPAVTDSDSAEEDASDQGSLEPSPGGLWSTLDTTPAADAAAFGSAGTPRDPNGEQVPWTEPALPMPWPPGMGALDRTKAPESSHEDSDDESRLQPDPTWPRLFGRTSDGQDADMSGETTSPAEARGPAGDELSTESHQNPPSPEEETGSPGNSDETEAVAIASTPVVDVSSTDRPAVAQGTAEAPRSPDQAPGARGINSSAAETTTLATEGTTTPASISTTTRAESAEEDVRDASTPLPSVNVSRETSAGGGEGMEEREDEALEDEAAIAVREAVTRAAAEAGVDVSRETDQLAQGAPIDNLDQEPSVDTEAAARNARVTFRIHRDSLNGMRRVVAVANQKGGVGKSTTAVNIGAYLALAGARVLVIDLDPQGNASTGLGLDHRDIEPSVYDVLTGEAVPAAAIRATGVANLHVLPSTIDLAGAEVELVSAMSRETRLRRALQSVDHQYDTILIDCPPSLGLLTVNALAAADELLIPIQCEYYALEGLGQLLRNVELVRANLNPELRIGGIVLTMYDGRTRLALQVVEEVRKHFTDLVFQTVVPRSVRLSEAPGYGVPIALYDPLSRGGIAYRDLTFELAERSGLLAPTEEGAS